MKLFLLFSIPLILATTYHKHKIDFCATPETGSYWNKEELVRQSKNIILAKAIFYERKENRDYYTFEILEVLKGKEDSAIIIPSYLDTPIKNHFSSHTSSSFWAENTGRSPYPCCVCQPLHTFEEGKTYLLFPDAIGAMASAEIIISKHDKWLKYVKNKLNNKRQISYN